MSENRCSTMLEVSLAFVVGGLIGAGIALLYAPAAGVETRKKVRETTDKIRGRMKEGYEAAIEKAEEEAGVAREFIGEKVSEVKAAYSAGRDAYIKEKEKYAQKAS